jgi:hypothetical protein
MAPSQLARYYALRLIHIDSFVLEMDLDPRLKLGRAKAALH